MSGMAGGACHILVGVGVKSARYIEPSSGRFLESPYKMPGDGLLSNGVNEIHRKQN